jgi:hypothetical protein
VPSNLINWKALFKIKPELEVANAIFKKNSKLRGGPPRATFKLPAELSKFRLAGQAD